MKSLNTLVALLGGMAIGAAIGILFAPAKGEDTRSQIVEALQKRGINLSREEMNKLVDEIIAQIKKGKEKFNQVVSPDKEATQTEELV